MLSNITLSKTYHGSNVIVGISGTTENITRFFYGIFNWDGCPAECELEWIKEGTNGSCCLAKFQTDEERLLRALMNCEFASKKGERGKVEKDVITAWDEVEMDIFLNERRNV
jgi:hypothetical protein